MSQVVLWAMFAPGPQEIIVCLIIGFLLFGAQRLPKIARSIGSSFISFKKGLSGIEDDVKEVTDEINEKIKE